VKGRRITKNYVIVKEENEDKEEDKKEEKKKKKMNDNDKSCAYLRIGLEERRGWGRSRRLPLHQALCSRPA
jgi:hypothetical protein